jgi:hypothetical protein
MKNKLNTITAQFIIDQMIRNLKFELEILKNFGDDLNFPPFSNESIVQNRIEEYKELAELNPAAADLHELKKELRISSEIIGAYLTELNNKF